MAGGFSAGGSGGCEGGTDAEEAADESRLPEGNSIDYLCGQSEIVFLWCRVEEENIPSAPPQS